jgi:hypothetical protein
MGPNLFHADRRRDTTKLIIAFRNFSNAPNNDVETSENIADVDGE